MIIRYTDDTFVTVHLGDFNNTSTANDICWLRLDSENEWIRSPYTIIATRELLRRVQSTSELNFDDAYRIQS